MVPMVSLSLLLHGRFIPLMSGITGMVTSYCILLPVYCAYFKWLAVYMEWNSRHSYSASSAIQQSYKIALIVFAREDAR